MVHIVPMNPQLNVHPQALSYVLRARQPLSPRRPANKILILPPIGKLLVLSEGVLQFFYLPNLDPVPNNVITPIRGVVTVALDDQEVALQIVDTSGTGMEMSVCVVKKKTVALYRLGTRMSWIQVRSNIVYGYVLSIDSPLLPVGYPRPRNTSPGSPSGSYAVPRRLLKVLRNRSHRSASDRHPTDLSGSTT